MSDSDEILFDDIYELHEVIGNYFFVIMIHAYGLRNRIITSITICAYGSLRLIFQGKDHFLSSEDVSIGRPGRSLL